MASEDDSRGPTNPRILLEGRNNFKSWQRHIDNTLLYDKDELYEIVMGRATRPTTPAAASAVWLRRDLRAYGYINASLSETVFHALPHHLQTAEAFNRGEDNLSLSHALYTHLTGKLDAVDGSYRAELLHMIWRTDLPEGTNPDRHIAGLQANHAALLSGGGSTMSEAELAYALVMSLPPSFETIKQSLFLSPTLTMSAAAHAVRTEWRRRIPAQNEGGALLAVARPPNLLRRLRGPYNGAAYCEHHRTNGHHTRDCLNPHVQSDRNRPPQANNGTRPAANVTEATSPGPQPEAHIALTCEALLANATPEEIVVDSGATHHMFHDRSLLNHPVSLPTPLGVTVGNGAVIQAVAKGDVKLPGLTLRNVLLVPGLGRNLLSIGKAQDEPNRRWTFVDNTATLTDSGSAVLLTAKIRNGLYILDKTCMPLPHSALLSSVSDPSLFDWHCRLAHLNIQAVLRLGRTGRLGEGVYKEHWVEDSKTFSCNSCLQGKGKRQSSPISSIRATKPLCTIHVDLWGPSRALSLGGKSYFLTCYDDFSRKIHLSFLARKSDAPEALIAYIALAENQLDHTVKVVRSDRGGEFTSSRLQQYFAEKGIEHHQVPTAAHAQNGRVERVHLTILDIVRTVLLDSGLGDEFWAEAANYAAYTRNHSPSGPAHIIPEDLWRGRQVELTHLRPFGCSLFFRDHNASDKLHRRYLPGLLLSYDEGTTNYRVWDIPNSKVVSTRDVTFKGTHGQLPRTVQATRAAGPDRTPVPVLPTTAAVEGGNQVSDSGTVLNSNREEEAQHPQGEPPQHSLPEELAHNPSTGEHQISVTSPTPETDHGLKHHKGWTWEPIVEEPAIVEDTPVELTRASRQRKQPSRYTPSEPSTSYATLIAEAQKSSALPKSFREAHHSAEWPEWEKAIKTELSKMAEYKV